MSLRRDLLLLLKTLTCFAWGRDPAVQAAVGVEPRCSLGSAGDDPSWDPPAPPLDPAAMRASRRGRAVRRRDRRLGRRRRHGGAGARRARARRDRARGGRLPRRRDLSPPIRSTRCPRPVSRRRADRLRGSARDPAPGGPLRRRHDGRQLGHLPAPARRRARPLARRVRDRLGHGSRGGVRRGRARPARGAGRPGDRRPQRRAVPARVPRRSARRTARSPRNAGRVECCGTCPTGCAIDAKQAPHVSELPRAVAAGARVRAGARVERVLIENGRAAGVGGDAAARTGLLRGARARRRARGRRARHARAAAAPGDRERLRAGRPPPARPPRLLGRRPATTRRCAAGTG